jgi:hypothetical protein
MKFGAHQTFHLREGWILKGLNAVAVDPEIFAADDAVVTLGVGKNQVDSIQYWLTALKLVEKKKSGFEMTALAKLVHQNDPYLELDGTLILTHYLLATNKEEATAWYWFFNKFAATEFEAESLKVYLHSFIQSQTDKSVKPETLARDIQVLIRTYRDADYGDKENPETENPSPFSKFAFISEVEGKFKRNKIRLNDLPVQVFVYLMYLFWKEELGSPKSIQLDEMVGKDCSPGMALGMSLDDMLSVVETIEREYPGKYLQFSRTGGYMILTINEKEAKSAMNHYYKAMGAH